MLSKEEILTYVQQGQVRPDWLVIQPKPAYFVRYALVYVVLAIVIIVLGVLFISQNSMVFVPGYGSGGTLDPNTFQTWRYIDLAVLGVLFLFFAGAALKHVFDLNNLSTQLLVLMPEGFLLKEGNKEQTVAYASVNSMSARADRYGNVALNIRAIGAKTVYRVRFDGRFGKSRALASQILTAQRQFAAGRQANNV